MTAKEIYQANSDKLLSTDFKVLKATTNEIYQMFLSDILHLTKIRNVRSNEGGKAIIKELNQKWNSLCNIINKKRGENIMQLDGFKNQLCNDIPETNIILGERLSHD